MLKRLLVGLLLGLIVGGLVAAGVVKGLGDSAFTGTTGVLVAYAAAVVTGALAGLLAGKPVWAEGAWIEVALKAFFGSLLAAGGMFALRRWGVLQVNVGLLGNGAVGELPATSLPILATVLSVFYELDNTDAPAVADKANVRVQGQGPRSRVAEDDTGEEDVAEPKSRMKK